MANSDYDFKALVDSYSDSLDILNEILGIFAEETPDRLRSLKTAAAAGDFPTVHKIAHGLANTTGTLKADRALETAREIETHARAERSDGLVPLVERLEGEVQVVLDQIEAYKAKA